MEEPLKFFESVVEKYREALVEKPSDEKDFRNAVNGLKFEVISLLALACSARGRSQKGLKAVTNNVGLLLEDSEICDPAKQVFGYFTMWSLSTGENQQDSAETFIKLLLLWKLS